jgi:hypothetical protein
VSPSPRLSKKRKEDEEDVDPMMLPPQKRAPARAELEEGPRWLHFMAGLVVGLFLGGVCARFLWRRLGIAPMNTIVISSLVFAVAGAMLRGKLWRWLKL